MILNKDAFIKLRSKKQKASRLIKTDMNCHLNVFIWKIIFIYFGIFSQLTSRIAMSWTYLQTISTQCFPSSYFEEKTEASFQRDWTRVKISNLDGEKRKSVAVSSFNTRVGTDQAASNDKKFCRKNLGEKWKTVANREITWGWVRKIKYILNSK